MNDFVTVLRHPTHALTKTWKQNGLIAAGAEGKYFTCTETPTGSIQELSKMLSELEKDSGAAVVRGRYIGHDPAVKVEPETKKGRVLRRKSLFEDIPHNWLMLDIDAFKSRHAPLAETVDAIDEFIITCLPRCFHGMSYHWQLSSSAGHASKDPALLRCHIWFWLEKPCSSAQLREWALAENLPVDLALFDSVQLHYTASPLFEAGLVDSISTRSGFSEGDFGDAVNLALPDVAPNASTSLSRAQKLQQVRAADPIVDLLKQRGLVKSGRSDGGLNIECPRGEYHTGISADSATVYYAAFTGGHARGAFVCLHSHCRDAPQSAFYEALAVDELEGVFPAVGAGFETYGDLSNGRRFAQKYRGQLLHTQGRWYAWCGSRWGACQHGEQTAAAKTIAEDIIKETLAAVKADGTEAAKRNHTHALAVHRSIKRLEAMVQSAASEPGMSIANPGLFDADPWKIGVRNGLVDLRNGEILRPSPDLLISRQAGVAYDPQALCPRWLGFLDQALAGDAEMIAFMQRLCGYILTGFVNEEILAFIHGVGANGKSVFANVIAAAMGDYAVTVRAALLARDPKGSGSDAEREKARLPGARLALVNETGQGDVFDDQRIKEITSRERVSARHLYGESFDFMPTHKLVVRGNHLPGALDASDGFWRRIVLIHFSRKIKPSECVADFDQRIIDEELTGVFAWMVEGCLKWGRKGLRVPSVVSNAVASYRKDTDLLGEWLRLHCVQSRGDETSLARLFHSYETFTRDAHIKPPSRNLFGRQLAARGYGKRESNGKVLYSGIAIRMPWDDEL